MSGGFGATARRFRFVAALPHPAPYESRQTDADIIAMQQWVGCIIGMSDEVDPKH
jgi:hypothetical protein